MITENAIDALAETEKSDREATFDKMVEKAKSTTEKNESSQEIIRFGNYFLDQSGLYYDPDYGKESKEEQKKDPIWISSPIYPIAYLRDVEGKNHSLLLKLHDGEKNHLWAMPRRLLGKWPELNDTLLDLGQKTPTTPQNQKNLLNFLMQAFPENKMRCVDKAGWHADQYVFPDGEVIGSAEDRESVYPINEICPKGVKQKGSLDDWQKNVLSLCIGNSRLIFSIGTALASMCLQLIGEDSGGFNFKGRSSIGKTKCLKAAVSVFGSPDYKRSWKTTANGLEGVCALYNDSLLPLDEFGQSDAKEAGEISYMISQGMGKQRAARDGTAREPKTWKVMILSTGELGLEEHMREGKKVVKAGQMARVADIPAEVAKGYGCFERIHNLKDGEEFSNELDKACGIYYGTAARAFIKGIVNHGIENTRRDLRFAIDDFVADNANDCDGQVKRVARRFGLVYSALFLAKKFGVLGAVLTDDEAKSAVKICYQDWLGDRGTTGDIESHNLVEQITGLLHENADGKFIGTDSVDETRIRQTVWGYKDGAKFYVLPKAFKENLCQGFDPTQAAKILIEKGLLIPDNAGKSSTNKKIPAHTKKQDRFYVIDLTEGEET